MNKNEALIVVDVQNDFLEGGALGVNKASEIIAGINQILPLFETVVFTQDWHPADHISFAANHPGMNVYQTIEVSYGPQILWPTHCVQNSFGSEIASALTVGDSFVQRKGMHREIDSYSAFLEADRKTNTGLDAFLRSKGISTVYICGLATDFCVSWSAIDAREMGFDVVVLEDLCRGLDIDGSIEKEMQKWDRMGIRIQKSNALTK